MNRLLQICLHPPGEMLRATPVSWRGERNLLQPARGRRRCIRGAPIVGSLRVRSQPIGGPGSHLRFAVPWR